MEQNNKFNQSSEGEQLAGSSRSEKSELGKTALKTVSRSSEQDSSHQQAESTSRTRAESFIRRHGKMLSLFSKDASLQFQPDESIETFAFDAEKFRILVPLKWFSDEKYAEGELEFANYHERAHFIDMRVNPEAYLENFHQMEADAKALAKKYCSTHPSEASLGAVEKYYYQELHTLFNCLDDIYVNDVIASRVPFFKGGDGRKSVISLYGKLGFGDADQTKAPLHRQLVFALLRDAMVGEELGQSQVDERVEDVLSRKTMGKTLRQLVGSELKSKGGILVDPAERYKLIRTFIQPSYLSLLEESLRERDEQNSGQEESDVNTRDNADSSSGDSSADEFSPFGEQEEAQGAFDEISDDIIKDVLKSMEEDEKMKKMSPEERAQYQEKKRMEKFDKDNGITQQERKENELVKTEIAKPRHMMRKFWQNLIGKSIEFRTVKLKEQRRGRLNVGSYIRKYSDIIEAERNGKLREMKVYDRLGLEREMIDQPETIDVTLLVDCSGSMAGRSEAVAKKTAALLMYSLKDFNSELERTRNKTHSKLRANSQVIAFGSDFEEIKGFNRGASADKSDATIIKSISSINSSRGSTNDTAPLSSINEGVTTEQKKQIKDGKLKKIVFLITDGVSNTPKDTAQKLQELSQNGVITVGFQIGEISEPERDAFERVWSVNTDSKQRPVGIYIGKDIDALPERLMESLSDLLSNIKI